MHACFPFNRTVLALSMHVSCIVKLKFHAMPAEMQIDQDERYDA